MPYWLKFTPDNQNYPIAMGPFDLEADADAAQAERVSPPVGDPPTDAGTVVEGDLGYPHTLKHPIGKQADGAGQDNILYSDGSLEPIA